MLVLFPEKIEFTGSICSNLWPSGMANAALLLVRIFFLGYSSYAKICLMEWMRRLMGVQESRWIHRRAPAQLQVPY